MVGWKWLYVPWLRFLKMPEVKHSRQGHETSLLEKFKAQLYIIKSIDILLIR
jgi:hypothetical protein